jgi:serine protease Do
MNDRTCLLITAAIAGLAAIGCASSSTKKSAATLPAKVDASPKALLERVRPSLVAVRYTFDGEMGRREIEGAGVVVNSDGLVAFSDGIVPPQLPDAQIINFKIVLPPGTDGPDETELDATFLGRDERGDLAFCKPAEAARTWTPLKPADCPLDVGDSIVTVGMLPKGSGYAAYARTATISAKLRGPVPLILTSGGLTAVGSPVFDKHGDFVALVPEFAGQNPMLNPEGDDTAALINAPVMIVPISDYLPSLNDPPTAPGSRKVPWLGVVQMTGLKKEVAEFYGLKGKVGVQVGDVIPNGAADKAGLKGGEIITQVNGQDLERGDTPEELPIILSRQMTKMNVGDEVTLTVIRKKGAEPEPIKLTLQERPAPANTAARFYAEDLGYTVRDLVFQDRYSRRLDDNFPGVTATFVKPQGNAQAGGLQRGDVVTKLNQIDVTNVEQFKKAYEEFRKASPKEAVVLEVLRGVDTQIIRIQPPQ